MPRSPLVQGFKLPLILTRSQKPVANIQWLLTCVKHCDNLLGHPDLKPTEWPLTNRMAITEYQLCISNVSWLAIHVACCGHFYNLDWSNLTPCGSTLDQRRFRQKAEDVQLIIGITSPLGTQTKKKTLPFHSSLDIALPFPTTIHPGCHEEFHSQQLLLDGISIRRRVSHLFVSQNRRTRPFCSWLLC